MFSLLTRQGAFWKSVRARYDVTPLMRRILNLFVRRCIGRVVYVKREGAVTTFHSRPVTSEEVRVSYALGGGVFQCARGYINCDVCPSRKRDW